MGAFITAFFIVGLTEEFFKYLSVRIKAFKSPDFNEVMDGIVYGVAAMRNSFRRSRKSSRPNELRDVHL